MAPWPPTQLELQGEIEVDTEVWDTTDGLRDIGEVVELSEDGVSSWWSPALIELPR